MKAFTDLDMADMREYFIQLLNDIPDERMKVTREKLIEYLDKKGFFTAPASVKYHSHVNGGLCYHSLRVLENLKLICQMKGLNYTIDTLTIVALFHDIAKPQTKRNKSDEPENDSENSFYNHDMVGERIARNILRRMKFPNEEVKQIRHLIKNHMFYYTDEWTDGAVTLTVPSYVTKVEYFCQSASVSSHNALTETPFS